MNRILILGASGFIGNAIYKELLPYFNVFGTYCTSQPEFDENQVFFQFDIKKDSIESVLEEVKPNYIISSLRGSFKSQHTIHEHLVNYTLNQKKCRILYY